MTFTEKQTIREVKDTINTHYTVISNNLKHKARLGKSILQDLKEGMGISIDKLNELLGETTVRFRNFYRCRPCGEKWQDEWDSKSNDHCPQCHAEIEPYKSIKIF